MRSLLKRALTFPVIEPMYTTVTLDKKKKDMNKRNTWCSCIY